LKRLFCYGNGFDWLVILRIGKRKIMENNRIPTAGKMIGPSRQFHRPRRIAQLCIGRS
jgi:hypothetical protein